MSSNASFVASVYRCILQREPDEAGLRNYVQMLEDGRIDRCDLLHEIAGSAESHARNGDGSRGRARRAFGCAYGRDPDGGELEAVGRIASRIDASSDRDYLRAAVLAFDRYWYPTSVGVRFIGKDLATIPLPHSDRAHVLDRADISVSHVLIGDDVHEPHLRALFTAFVREGMTVADVGANVGTHTVMLADLVGPRGRVLAFEPNTENARLLSLTKARCRLDNIVILPLALSTSIGSAAFSPAIGSNGGFMPDEAATILHPNCTIVPTMPMDLVLGDDRVDFIKIDVEGAEDLVLSGAGKLIGRCRPIITSEFSPDMLSRVSGVAGADYLRRVRQLGYRLYTLGISGPVVEIHDIDAALADWGAETRIEDFLFLPVEDARGLFELQAILR